MATNIYLLLLLIIASVTSERNLRVVIDKLILKNLNPDLIAELSSQTFQQNNRSYVSGQLRVNRIINDMEIRSTMDLVKLNNQTMRLFNLRLDACKYLEGTHKSKILNIFLKTIKNHASGNISCPLKPSLNYTLDKWYFEAKIFPAFVPDCKFQGSIDVFTQNQKLVNAKFYGQVTRD